VLEGPAGLLFQKATAVAWALGGAQWGGGVF
jgi:hypothetical protein